MKDVSSRSVASRTGSDPSSSTPDITAVSPGVTVASGTKTCFKDPMFSSSDTDDCDADKLVIDLDAAGSTEASSTSDNKQTSASVPVPIVAPAVSKSEPTKVRTDGSASKSSSGGSHRQQPSSGKSGSNQQSDGQQSSQSLPDKGLKMKIKCSQVGGAGGPARHEISQFHTLVNSAVPSSSSSTSSSSLSACPSNSSASTAKTSCTERIVEKDKDALVRIDRIPPSGSGSHRKDHRTGVKERSTNNVKDRSTSDGQLQNPSACIGANIVQASSISLSPSSLPNNYLPVSCGTAVTKEEASAKSVAVDSEKETITTTTARNNAPLSQQDPYEFNVKVEESIVGRPTKKIKLDKFDAACSPMPGCLSSDQSTAPAETRDVSVDACHVGVVTDPDCLGPCEPGTTVTLEGIVWNETENGLLVVNVTWRGKTYVGTLMDATKHHWAPPRFATDSPTSDLDGRTPKGRGKRGRTCTAAAARSEINCSDRKLRSNRCAASAAAKSGVSSAGSNSPVRSDVGPLGAPVAKRPRVSESQAGNSSSSSDVSRTASKQSRSESRMSVSADNESNGGDGILIECPAPNCSKKYRHINGLRYHQSRSHPNMNFDDDIDDLDGDVKSVAVGSKIRNDVDGAELESASDVDKTEVGEALTGSSSQSSDATSKQEKKSKSERPKSKSITKQSQIDIQDAPRSPSKAFPDDATNVEKQKFRKKERERAKDSAVVDPSVETEVTVTVDAVKSSPMFAGKKCETIGLAVSLNKIPSVEAEVPKAIGSVDYIKAVNCCSETVSVIRTAAEVNSSINSLTNGELSLSVLQASCEMSSIDDAVLVEKGDTTVARLSSSMLSVMDSSVSSPGPIISSKRPKATPTKYASEFDNPHSPAYSDISDANDSAPMLEKEATPSSASVDDENLTTSGNSMVERCPVSQRLTENFPGPFNGLASSSSLYGQPPCLTPAVVSPPLLDVPSQQSVNVKVEKMDTSISNHQDERTGHSSSNKSMRPQIPPRTGDAIRHPGPEMSELTERGLGSVQRTVSRSHGGDGSSPQPLQPTPTMLPPNMFMQYPYGPVPGGYPPLELMQHPDYRAQYERLVQQGMIRRPDQPPSSMVRPPLDLPPDFKGFPCVPKPVDIDRKSKSDGQLPPGSLPTPPSLIPDRGSAPYDEQDNRIGKPKSSDRRDDGQRSSYSHQQYSSGSERQRRHDDSSSAKESGSNKPSAVVAPQARDRITSSSNSSKMRPDDSSRSGSSSHDHSRTVHKSTPKGSSALQESPSSRQLKDSTDRSGRDDKQAVAGRSGGNSNPYKKEDSGMSISPINSVPLPLPSTYPPYYPYLPTQFDTAAFYGGLNPMIGYAGAPPGPFLHPAQVGYLPSASGDVGGMMSPSVGPHLSPSDGKPRDVPPRSFYPGNDGVGSAPSTVHKIHELKEVAKGCSGSGGDSSQSVTGASTGSVLRDMRPESRSGAVGGSVGLPKDLERGGTSSPPTQRHVHTHHHMHMLGPAIPPLFGGVFPSDPSMLSSSQAGSTPNNCPPLSRPFIGK